MKEYSRKHPSFSLCGLNCSLCPNYHSKGISKCPGCGGLDFYLKHPSCSVINCNIKHDNVEFCYECSLYPCSKYKDISKTDSFITYNKVLSDFKLCNNIGIDKYIDILNKKEEILKYLLSNYNNGRLKSYFCLVVNLFDIKDLEEVIKNNKDNIVELFNKKAKEKNIDLKLIK